MSSDEAGEPKTHSQTSSSHAAGPNGDGEAVVLSRYRIRFGKTGPLRYCSLLDLTLVWERTLRRAGVPLAYSQGFNPRPRIQIAAGLPVGYASTCEIVDVWLTGEVARLDTMLAELRRVVPDGLEVETVQPVELREPALQSQTRLAEYRVVLTDNDLDPAVLSSRLEATLKQEHIWRERRGKRYDLRPLIEQAELLPGRLLVLRLVLALSPSRGTARPDELLDVLEIDPLRANVTRTAIMFEDF
jgi:radical SAM-linked protein